MEAITEAVLDRVQELGGLMRSATRDASALPKVHPPRFRRLG